MEPRRLKALLLAVLLLVPALLCAADLGIPALRDTARRFAAVEGIHCFCHDASRAGDGSVRDPDAPSPRALYFPLLAPRFDAGPAGPGFLALLPAPPELLPREPLTPPPIGRV